MGKKKSDIQIIAEKEMELHPWMTEKWARNTASYLLGKRKRKP